jgi:hypothetical protein
MQAGQVAHTGMQLLHAGDRSSTFALLTSILTTIFIQRRQHITVLLLPITS